MRPFATIERLIERLVERPSARLFRTRLQPVQLQRRIERAMETERRSGTGGVLVPDRYVVRLHPDDLAALPSATDVLTAQLADGALTFARAHRYHLAGRPMVAIVSSRAVARGDVAVDASFAPFTATQAEPALRPVGAAVTGPTDEKGSATDIASVDGTAVYAVRAADPPIAILREVRPGAPDRTVVLDGRPVTVGRGADNDVVVADPLVSRHHIRLQARRGALILTDLESLNGSRVNGVTVTEVALGGGDRIQVGNTVLVVDPPPGG